MIWTIERSAIGFEELVARWKTKVSIPGSVAPAVDERGRLKVEKDAPPPATAEYEVQMEHRVLPGDDSYEPIRMLLDELGVPVVDAPGAMIAPEDTAKSWLERLQSGQMIAVEHCEAWLLQPTISGGLKKQIRSALKDFAARPV